MYIETERLTASVELLPMRFSQVSLWLFSSGVLLAMSALWITRFGVLVKENALVTWHTHTHTQRISNVLY